MSSAFRNSIRRQLRRMSRPMWIIMLLVPLGVFAFFVTLMQEGLPLKVPTAVVDMDHSQMSRSMIRSLNAMELIDIVEEDESFNMALDHVKSGDIFGFFVIPENFEEDAIGGRTPTLNYYTNMTFFVPGTLSFKGFKTIAVTTAGGVIVTTLTSVGVPSGEAQTLVQPVSIDPVGIGNPWTNYTYYLTPSFSMALLALIIMIMTCYSITVEIKHGTSPEWLETAGGSIFTAVCGKLLPQTVAFTVIGLAMEAMMFGFMNFPMAGSLWIMAVAMVLFVIANQGFALFVTCVLPNPRLSLSIVSLLGILTFSFAGFSFPVEKMYGAIAIFAYLVPVRYLFLIYINTALNGFDPYYVRWCFVALMVFPFIGFILINRLKKACLHPVYVP